MKQKKISIKPFLNRNLSPTEQNIGILIPDIVHCYPLYYQITFERKNTQVKSYFVKYYSDMDEAKAKDTDLLDFETAILSRLVAFDKEKFGSGFTLSGIKARYEIYILPIETVFESYLKKKLLKLVKYSNTEFLPIIKFDGFEVNFTLLYKASKLLIKGFDNYLSAEFKAEIDAYEHFSKVWVKRNWDFNYITVLEWLDGNFKDDLKIRLTEHLEKKSRPDKVVGLLDNMITDKIRFIGAK